MYCEDSHISVHHEIWCVSPIQLIDVCETLEEAEDELKKYIDFGVSYDGYTDRIFDPNYFIIVPPGENIMDDSFFKKEEYRIRGWIELDSVE